MNNTLLVFVGLIGLLWISSCKKDNEVTLPEATSRGANTFGCLVDGHPYMLTRKATNSNPNGVIYNLPTAAGYIYISAGNVISLNFKYSGSPGTYEMADEYPYRGIYFNTDNGTAVTGSSEFKTDSIHKGAVTITFFDGNIIAGTFWFDAVNDNGQVVHVTNGRFDISQ